MNSASPMCKTSPDSKTMFGSREVTTAYLLCQWDAELCAHAVETLQDAFLPAALKDTQKWIKCNFFLLQLHSSQSDKHLFTATAKKRQQESLTDDTWEHIRGMLMCLFKWKQEQQWISSLISQQTARKMSCSHFSKKLLFCNY